MEHHLRREREGQLEDSLKTGNCELLCLSKPIASREKVSLLDLLETRESLEKFDSFLNGFWLSQTELGCRNVILKRGVDTYHARVSVGDQGLRETLFIYFNIVCSQSKSKSSLLSKEPIARKFFDGPRLKLTKLDNFQHTSKYNNR